MIFKLLCLFSIISTFTKGNVFNLLLHKLKNKVAAEDYKYLKRNEEFDEIPRVEWDDKVEENDADGWVEMVIEMMKINFEAVNSEIIELDNDIGHVMKPVFSVSLKLIPKSISGVRSIKTFQHSKAKFEDEDTLSAEINLKFNELQFRYEVNAHIIWFNSNFETKFYFYYPQITTNFRFDMETQQITLNDLHFHDPKIRVEISCKYCVESFINYLLNLFQNFYKNQLLKLLSEDLKNQLESYINELQ